MYGIGALTNLGTPVLWCPSVHTLGDFYTLVPWGPPTSLHSNHLLVVQYPHPPQWETLSLPLEMGPGNVNSVIMSMIAVCAVPTVTD